MGLLDGTNQSTYYSTPGSYGNYQFVTLDSIISAFMFTYVGESKIISKVHRTDVQFHAMRSIQELSYDVFRSIKSQEIEVPNTLKMIIPQDYVNYVKLTSVGGDGIERNLYPTSKTSNPFAITQDASGVYQFEDTAVDADSDPDTIIEQAGGSNTTVNFQTQVSSTIAAVDATDSTDIELDFRGRRFGLDPQYAHQHGSFFIDPLKNYIHFSSNLSGKTIILKYISDGLGTDAEMVVHKFAEEAVYKSIAYGLLSVRTNIPEMIIQRFKREKYAETRKAKIRLSNIKIEEFTQVLKGMSKQIK